MAEPNVFDVIQAKAQEIVAFHMASHGLATEFTQDEQDAIELGMSSGIHAAIEYYAAHPYSPGSEGADHAAEYDGGLTDAERAQIGVALTCRGDVYAAVESILADRHAALFPTWPTTHDDPNCMALNCDVDHEVVREELRECFPGRLAENERWGYQLILDVIHRHSFHDHDCQTTICKAMFLWNSPELTQLLTDAYERGAADGPMPEPSAEQIDRLVRAPRRYPPGQPRGES